MSLGAGSSQPEDFFGAPTSNPKPVATPESVQVPDQIPVQVVVPLPGQSHENRISLGLGVTSLLLSVIFLFCSPPLGVFSHSNPKAFYYDAGGALTVIAVVFILLLALLAVILGIIAIAKSKAKPEAYRSKSKAGQVLGILGVVFGGLESMMMLSIILMMIAYILASYL
jgi:uncharacterized membrane protein